MNRTALPLPTPRGLAALATFVVGLLLAAAPLCAQDETAEDPPARVGRVAALIGAVEMSREPGAPWDPARLNLPVTTDTAFWAPPGSQAEVRIGSSAVRLDGNTQAVFRQLDDDAIVVDIAQGTVRARVRHLFEGDAFRLVADGVQVEAQEPGDYRVDYDPDRRAYTVRALAGRLRVVTPGTEFRLDAGQQTVVERGGASLQMSALGERDAFDAWAESRDRAQEQLAASRYVSPETTGIEALDEHGHWNVDDGYGPIWYPRVVAPGWAPYRYGHWTWVAPWGWSWVDDSPWGFAPFHYGRWALVGSRWGWVPGPIVRRPVWAPALVGYVGGGSLSVSIGIGRPIGWFPLGPWEHYHPSYRYSPRYVRHIDVINVVPPRRVRHHEHDRRDPSRYRYAQRADAVTVIGEEGFRGSRPVGRERIPLRPDQTARLQPALAGWGAGLQPARPTDNLLPPPPRRPDREARDHRGWRGQPDRPDRPDRRETPPRWASDGPRDGLPDRVGREPLPPRDFRDGRFDRGARTDGDGRRDRADRDDGTIGNRPGRIDPRPPAPRVEVPPQPVPRPLPGMQPVPPMPADRQLPSVRPVPPMPADRPLPAVRPVPPLQGAEPPPRRQPLERPPRQERHYDGPRERSPTPGRPAATAPVGRPDRAWSATPPRPVAQPAPRSPAAQAPVIRAPVERARFERQARPDGGPQGRNPRALER